MKTKENLIVIAAPFLVLTAIILFIAIPFRICMYFNINDLFTILNFMPEWVIRWVGGANVTAFLPIFIIGFATLGRKGAVGQTNKLRTWSVYKYVRNPMYAGISFTIVGIGCLFGITSLVISGLIWLLICYFQSRNEERELMKRFGYEYNEYKNRTPRFIPDFERLIHHGFKKNINKGINF